MGKGWFCVTLRGEYVKNIIIAITSILMRKLIISVGHVFQERDFMAKQASECEEYHKRHIEEQRKCIFEREMAFLNKKHDLIRGMRFRIAIITRFHLP